MIDQTLFRIARLTSQCITSSIVRYTPNRFIISRVYSNSIRFYIVICRTNRFAKYKRQQFSEVTIDVSSMESNPITVTWKYTIVGPKIEKHRYQQLQNIFVTWNQLSWPLPSLRGGRILSYIFGSAGKISENVRPFLKLFLPISIKFFLILYKYTKTCEIVNSFKNKTKCSLLYHFS